MSAGTVRQRDHCFLEMLGLRILKTCTILLQENNVLLFTTPLWHFTFSTGIVSQSFMLSDQPNYGNWSIQVDGYVSTWKDRSQSKSITYDELNTSDKEMTYLTVKKWLWIHYLTSFLVILIYYLYLYQYYLQGFTYYKHFQVEEFCKSLNAILSSFYSWQKFHYFKNMYYNRMNSLIHWNSNNATFSSFWSWQIFDFHN